MKSRIMAGTVLAVAFVMVGCHGKQSSNTAAIDTPSGPSTASLPSGPTSGLPGPGGPGGSPSLAPGGNAGLQANSSGQSDSSSSSSPGTGNSPGTSPVPQGADAILQFSKDIGLNGDQQKQIRTAYDIAEADGNAIIQNQTMNQKDKMDRMNAVLKKQQAAIDQVLSKDQKTKLVELRGRQLGEMDANARISQWAKPLGLTESQKSMLTDAFIAGEHRASVIRMTSGLDLKDRLQKIQQVASDTEQSVTAILTPDQKNKLQKLEMEQSAASAAASMLDGMTHALNLTPDQIGKIRPILENDARSQMQLAGNKSMADKDKMDSLEKREKQTESRIRALLTPQQQQQWDKATAPAVPPNMMQR